MYSYIQGKKFNTSLRVSWILTFECFWSCKIELNSILQSLHLKKYSIGEVFNFWTWPIDWRWGVYCSKSIFLLQGMHSKCIKSFRLLDWRKSGWTFKWTISKCHRISFGSKSNLQMRHLNGLSSEEVFILKFCSLRWASWFICFFTSSKFTIRLTHIKQSNDSTPSLSFWLFVADPADFEEDGFSSERVSEDSGSQSVFSRNSWSAELQLFTSLLFRIPQKWISMIFLKT